MDYAKLIIYTACMVVSVFAVSGINFDGFIKKNHVWEARFLSIILSLSLTYCLGSLIISILGR